MTFFFEEINCICRDQNQNTSINKKKYFFLFSHNLRLQKALNFIKIPLTTIINISNEKYSWKYVFYLKLPKIIFNGKISLEVPWYANRSIWQDWVVIRDVEVQVGQFYVSFHQTFYAVDHQFRRDIIVFQYRVSVKFFNTKLVEVSFNVFVSETKKCQFCSILK